MKIIKNVVEKYKIEMNREDILSLLNIICIYIDKKPEQLDGWRGVDGLESFACKLRSITEKDNEKIVVEL